MFKYINGLCAVVYNMMGQEINRISIYLFCGIRFDRIKIIKKEQDGITLLYKHLDMKGRYRCTRNSSEVKPITWRQFDWLMSSLDIERPKVIGSVNSCFYVKFIIYKKFCTTVLCKIVVKR